ncbi:MAG: hypothetical protein EOO01_11815 [Chitinophagaceae bacterium]|nr:MAG: hypothetical protein EOO01_11815 [Chitinophagaceae bacterium]
MKNKSTLVLFICVSLFHMHGAAQQREIDLQPDAYEQAYIGLGIGLDHGGIGVRAEFLPAKWLGIFAGAGYNLVDPGMNAGASLKILPGKKVTPTAVIMYGYNAAIKIRNHMSGTDIHRESYSGFSAGAGVDALAGRSGNNKISFVVFLPFRNSVFHRDYDDFKEAGFEFKSRPTPFALSIGYSFGIAGKLRRH